MQIGSYIGFTAVSGGDYLYQTGLSYYLNGLSFKITEITADNKFIIDINDGNFVGTTLPSFNAYTGLHSNALEIDFIDGIESGNEIFLSDVNGNHTIFGQSQNGKNAKIIEISGHTLLLDSIAMGTSLATEGTVIVVDDYYDWKNVAPRVATVRVDSGSSAVINQANAATVSDAMEMGFTGLLWSELVAAQWQTLSGVILQPKVVKCLMRLNASDINTLDFGKPKYIEHFNAMFYLSLVSQYKVNKVESTSVELVKI